MKKRIILLGVALLIAVGIGNSDAIVGGFSTMRGFTTLPTNDYVPTSGGTMTGGLIGTTAAFSSTGIFGSTVASGSGFNFQVVSNNTSTSSIDFDSGGSKGTCIQVRAMNGSLAYARFTTSGIVVSTISCK